MMRRSSGSNMSGGDGSSQSRRLQNCLLPLLVCASMCLCALQGQTHVNIDCALRNFRGNNDEEVDRPAELQREEKLARAQRQQPLTQTEGSFSTADRHHLHPSSSGTHGQSCPPFQRPNGASSPPMQKRDKCDGLMGYGIEESFFVCEPQAPGLLDQVFGGDATEMNGKIQCHYNPTTKATYCEADNLRVDPSKIKVAKGGEPIFTVAGREEEAEFPRYKKGAFSVSGCSINDTSLMDDGPSEKSSQPNMKLPYHMIDMMKSVETSSDEECSKVEERPTLFVTRYEYANLYHTMTDYYNAYQAAMLATKGNMAAMDEMNIVFMDGHARGTLDVGWELLFPNANISYVSELNVSNDGEDNNDKSVTCFRRAIFVSPGYRSSVSIVSHIDTSVYPTPLSYLPACQKTEWQAEFRVRMIHGAMCRLQLWKGWMYPYRHDGDDTFEGHRMNVAAGSDTSNTTKITTVRVLFLLRKNYYSHPRMQGTTTRQIANEDEIEAAMQSVVLNNHHGKPAVFIETRRLILEQHDLSEQILMVQHADIIVGMHGAGLSHTLWATPRTLLLELKPPGFEGHGHFEPLTQLAGGIYESFMGIQYSQDEKQLTNIIPVREFKAAFRNSVEVFLKHHRRSKGSKMPS